MNASAVSTAMVIWLARPVSMYCSIALLFLWMTRVFSFPGPKPVNIHTHWVVEVCSKAFALSVRIITSDAWFGGGRPPMPRAEASDPGWTSWRGHGIVVDLTELDTCPRVLGIDVPCILRVRRWQGKYVDALSEESVADQEICGGGVGEREASQPACLSLFVHAPIVTASLIVLSPSMGSVNFLILLACIGVLHGTSPRFALKISFLIFAILSSRIFDL